MVKIYEKTNSFYFALLVILLSISYIWLKSSYGKIISGTFAQNLAASLEKFASANPNLWIKNFLNSTAIPNSIVFGNLTMWGELFAGLAIGVSSLYLLFYKKSDKLILAFLSLGLFTGAFLNLVFWLASGWMSASGESLNFLMFVVQVVALLIILRKFRN